MFNKYLQYLFLVNAENGWTDSPLLTFLVYFNFHISYWLTHKIWSIIFVVVVFVFDTSVSLAWNVFLTLVYFIQNSTITIKPSQNLSGYWFFHDHSNSTAHVCFWLTYHQSYSIWWKTWTCSAFYLSFTSVFLVLPLKQKFLGKGHVA